jgi:transposase
VRDRDWFDRRVWLDVPIRRLDCYQCGARAAERLSWLDTGERIVDFRAILTPVFHPILTPPFGV